MLNPIDYILHFPRQESGFSRGLGRGSAEEASVVVIASAQCDIVADAVWQAVGGVQPGPW